MKKIQIRYKMHNAICCEHKTDFKHKHIQISATQKRTFDRINIIRIILRKLMSRNDIVTTKRKRKCLSIRDYRKSKYNGQSQVVATVQIRTHPMIMSNYLLFHFTFLVVFSSTAAIQDIVASGFTEQTITINNINT